MFFLSHHLGHCRWKLFPGSLVPCMTPLSSSFLWWIPRCPWFVRDENRRFLATPYYQKRCFSNKPNDWPVDVWELIPTSPIPPWMALQWTCICSNPFAIFETFYDAVSKAIENVPYSQFHPSYCGGAQFRASRSQAQHPTTRLCMGAPRPFAIYIAHLLRGWSAAQELSMQNEARKIAFTYLHELRFSNAHWTQFFYRDLPLIRILLFTKYHYNAYLRRTFRSIENTKPNVILATYDGVINSITMSDSDVDVVSQILVWISDNISLMIPS